MFSNKADYDRFVSILASRSLDLWRTNGDLADDQGPGRDLAEELVWSDAADFVRDVPTIRSVAKYARCYEQRALSVNENDEFGREHAIAVATIARETIDLLLRLRSEEVEG